MSLSNILYYNDHIDITAFTKYNNIYICDYAYKHVKIILKVVFLNKIKFIS